MITNNLLKYLFYRISYLIENVPCITYSVDGTYVILHKYTTNWEVLDAFELAYMIRSFVNKGLAEANKDGYFHFKCNNFYYRIPNDVFAVAAKAFNLTYRMKVKTKILVYVVGKCKIGRV